MITLWGKKAIPDGSSSSPKAHFYSTQGGQILSADGSGQVLPEMGAVEAERREYIPRDFAAEKVSALVKDATVTKESYQAHVDQLHASYRHVLEDAKRHYEDLLQTLRQKAQRHVEINKQMRQEMEERLRKEIQDSEDALENLRDDMARLNRQYQDEVRKLKARINEHEGELARQQVLLDDHEVALQTRLVVNSLLFAVDCQHLQDKHDDEVHKMEEEVEKMKQEGENKLALWKQEQEEETLRKAEREREREECQQVLLGLLLQLEVQQVEEAERRFHQVEEEQEEVWTRRCEEVQQRWQVAEEGLAAAVKHNNDLSGQLSSCLQQIELLSVTGEKERDALLASHRGRLDALQREFSEQQEVFEAQARRAEVKQRLHEIVLAIEERQQRSSTLGDLQRQHADSLAATREQFEREMAALRRGLEEKARRQKAKAERAQVEEVVARLVGEVAERDRLAMAAAFEKDSFEKRKTKRELVEQLRGLRLALEAAQQEVKQQKDEVTRLQQLQEQLQLQLQQTQLEAVPVPVPVPAADEAVPAPAPAPVEGGAGGGGGGAAVVVVVEMSKQKEDEKQLEEEQARLRARLQEVLASQAMAQQHHSAALTEREKAKAEIKDWTKAFIEKNGREPEVADKALIKEKYQRYKASTGQAKEQEAVLASLLAEKEDLEKKLQQLDSQIKELPVSAPLTSAAPVEATSSPPPPAAAIAPQAEEAISMATTGTEGQQAQMVMRLPAVAVESKDAEVQVIPQELRGGGGGGGGGGLQRTASQLSLPATASGPTAEMIEQLQQAHEEEVEKLEDDLFDLRSQVEQLATAKAATEADLAFTASKLAELIQEKRTDIVKRYEDDLRRLEEVKKDQQEQITALASERSRLTNQLKEILSRAELAEQELRDRDQRELVKLNPTEEKSQLKTTINKQRDQIVLKSKAATAGWDAAAKADEKMEIEIERAYLKGMKEEREQHKKDLEAVNQALEKKEQRITELLVLIASKEKEVLQSNADQTNMKAQMEAMKLEVADAISAIQAVAAAGGGEDGEVVLPPSHAELEAARDQLDSAQEEVVHLLERCDRLEAELEVSRRRNLLFERLATLTGLDQGKTLSTATTEKKKKDLSLYDVNGVMANIKKVIVKCTNLWKSNRKDECFDLYLEACVSSLEGLLSEDLVRPLRESVEHGKSQGLQNKQRGAVVLRKALDKVLVDLGQTTVRQAEEEAVRRLREGEAASLQIREANQSSMIADAVQQLQALDDSLLEQGYTKEKNPTNTNMEEVAAAGGGGVGGAGGASLLQRARAAESQVEALKKQLAALITATAPAPDPVLSASSEGGAGAGGGAVVAAAGGGEVVVAGRNAGRGGGADPAEVRRLNRKIKELEGQLKTLASSGGGGGGGGGGASSAEVKALQANEKTLQKKLKDQETSFKRESKALEMRATKAENALQKIQAGHSALVSERDTLKAENAKLFQMTSELGTLKAKAERCDALDAIILSKDQELALLQEQFKKESQLRKKYKNELEDLKGAIRVFARCRPMARYEIERGCKAVVEIKDETSLRLTTSRGEKDFEFDAVFSPTSTQDQVFEDTKRLVESCMDGFNVCLFAYGQTGSGKTFTMTGSPDSPGLTPKAIDELFRLIAERRHLQVKVTTYFVELYNDNLVDLYFILDNKTIPAASRLEPPKLEIKMDNKKMVYVRNSIIKEANSAEELMDLFNKGNVERHTGATKMNAESSRSHSIFAIMVESYDIASRRTTTGKLSLVDLAGSERADKTGAGADRLKEAQSINKSLSALGDVIAALSEGGANKHIPYRNNKLTQLMQDSLGGNAKTLMFVNFSPADYNADETSTSLMYASRVKKIVNNASKQAESEEVARLKAMIRRLQAGQSTADLEEPEPPAEPEPVMEDDGKVYDGY
eukprot:gene3382-3707_t